jgi:hypothetical protein
VLSVGPDVGTCDIVGFVVGMVDIVGSAVGGAVGATPHSTISVHGIHTSVSLNRIFTSLGLEDLKPPMHWHRGLNAFPSSPTACARGSLHGASNCCIV